MLTEQQIFQFATSFRATHETAFVTGVQYGAKWANEQNAAEIDALQAQQTGIRELVNEQRGRIIDLEADVAEFVDAVREILNASPFLPSKFTDVEARARQMLAKYKK